jgi:hypothetical protein
MRLEVIHVIQLSKIIITIIKTEKTKNYLRTGEMRKVYIWEVYPNTGTKECLSNF